MDSLTNYVLIEVGCASFGSGIGDQLSFCDCAISSREFEIYVS